MHGEASNASREQGRTTTRPDGTHPGREGDGQAGRPAGRQVLWSLPAAVDPVPGQPQPTSPFDPGSKNAWNTAEEQRYAAQINWAAFRYYRRLERLEQQVLENLDQRLSRAEAADIAALGNSYFCRWFKEKAGVSYTVWSSFIRVQAAIELFRSQNYDVLNASLAVGYDDPGTFTRAFKRCSGLPPGEYKRRFCCP